MKIVDNSSLKGYTTLKIGGIAHKEYLLEDIHDVEQVAKLVDIDKEIPILIGGGSNVLIDDDLIMRPIIRDLIGSKTKPEIVQEDAAHVWLHVNSGMYLPVFLMFCAKHGFSGLEGLASVPGRMGGALAMNAGAFSCEMQDVFESARIFSPENGLKKYTRNMVDFNYRSFSLKNSVKYYIIVDMMLKLKKSTKEQVNIRIKENHSKKILTQPIHEKTAGSAFKNPQGNFAGKLLEDVQLKGFRINGIGFSSLHANFLVNYNNGTFKDALYILDYAKEAVFNQTGITLEREIKILSDKNVSNLSN